MHIDTSISSRGGGSFRPSSETQSSDSDASADASDAQLLAVTARQAAIRLSAYYRAERRGFVPGHELDDWLAAERQMSEIEALREEQYHVTSQA